jgi:hypothetical protein
MVAGFYQFIEMMGLFCARWQCGGAASASGQCYSCHFPPLMG